MKDVGLDPIQDDSTSPSNWPLEFKRLRTEIIKLWDACNVSLVHRTYFFLLFQGDPADSIYMEVELRRLSFLKDTFSQGNPTVVDGHALTRASRYDICIFKNSASTSAELHIFIQCNHHLQKINVLHHHMGPSQADEELI